MTENINNLTQTEALKESDIEGCLVTGALILRAYNSPPTPQEANQRQIQNTLANMIYVRKLGDKLFA